jgi:hypothetical protein
MQCFERVPGSPRLPSVHALQVHARILSVPYRPRPETRLIRAPCVARVRSCLRPCPFLLAPAVVLVGARHASVDSHLKLPTATLAGNSKKSYCSKVNLEQ